MSPAGLNVFERGSFPRWLKVRQELDATDAGDVAAAVAREFTRPEVDGRQSGPVPASPSPPAAAASTASTRCSSHGRRGAAASAASRSSSPRWAATAAPPPRASSSSSPTTASRRRRWAARSGPAWRRSCSATVEDDVPVYFDRIAYEEADAVIPVGRVKPHTDFHGPIESGLMKMIAIGLGKQKGADTFHSPRLPRSFHHLIPAVGQFTLSHVNMPFGIALVENGYGHLGLIEAIPGRPDLRARSRSCSSIARDRMGRLPGERIDVLLVDEIGKDISGDGADPNVINRDISGELRKSEINPKPEIHRVIFRDLTADTEGNATGVGLGDFVLRRARRQDRPGIDLHERDHLEIPEPAADMPMVVDNDRQAHLSRPRQRALDRGGNRQDRPDQEHQGRRRVLGLRAAAPRAARHRQGRAPLRSRADPVRRIGHAHRAIGGQAGTGNRRGTPLCALATDRHAPTQPVILSAAKNLSPIPYERASFAPVAPLSPTPSAAPNSVAAIASRSATSAPTSTTTATSAANDATGNPGRHASYSSDWR